MIIPTKHTNFSESLLGFGSYILSQLESPLSIDELWNRYQTDYQNKLYFARHSFDNLLLTIVFLYLFFMIADFLMVLMKGKKRIYLELPIKNLPIPINSISQLLIRTNWKKSRNI